MTDKIEREQLGFIRNIQFGCRDTNKACLFFDLVGLDGTSLQILEGHEALDFVTKSKVYDIDELNGKAVVYVTVNGMMIIKRLFEE